jgi:hypothetical protein
MSNTDIIRVGDDYFKYVQYFSADQELETKMVAIKRQTITDDFGREFLRAVPKFDMFCNIPDNDGTKRIPSNLYNLYTPLNHRVKHGEWKWTKTLLTHIYQEQYELGLDYIQLLYEKPLQLLPVLCLVSKENQTGKTTFLNWLRMIFKENMIVIGNQEIQSQFNFMYGHKLIIAIEESRIERTNVLEKIKAMATQTKVVMNEKFQRAHTVDYFGKIILVSNHEDNFISANKEDIRYWIRKVPKIPAYNENFDIEHQLRDEVPAFLHYLKTREFSTQKKSRAWFAPELIETSALNRVREYSHTPLYFDLREALTTFFANNPLKIELKATAKMIIDNLLNKKNEYNTKYLTKVLKDEFEKASTYGRFTEDQFMWTSQPGHFYVFNRSEFITDDEEEIDAPETLPF